MIHQEQEQVNELRAAPAASMYFVAIVCPDEINREVKKFKKWMKDQYGCTVALKSPAHITLVKPFWLEKNWEEYLLSSLKACETGVPPFDISLRGFSHFGKRVIYVDVVLNDSLSMVKNRVEAHFIRTFGDHLKKEQLPFQPHVTIANRDLKPSDFDKAWIHFQKEKYRRTFTAEAISLLKLEEGKWQLLDSRLL
jgi:2'-5' RNA ligase